MKIDLMKYRTEMFGFSSLLIVYHHLGNRGVPLVKYLPDVLQSIIVFVLSKAYIGVEMFVFLSAVGLCFSMSRNTVKRFYFNRFLRTFVWLTIMFPVFIYEDLIVSRGEVGGFLLDISTLRYWVDNNNTHTPWFVPFIILLYLVFPLIYWMDRKTKHFSTVLICVISVGFLAFSQIYPNQVYLHYRNCFARIPIFTAGILLAERIKNGITFTKKQIF